MSHHSANGRAHYSSSSGSPSYQGITSRATSPVYHLPQNSDSPVPNYSSSYKKNYRDGAYSEDSLCKDFHNYYDYNVKPSSTNHSSGIDVRNHYDRSRDYRNEYTYSDDSSSFSIPTYHKSSKRHSRNGFVHEHRKKSYQHSDSRHHTNKRSNRNKESRIVVLNNTHKLYSDKESSGGVERLYTEAVHLQPHEDVARIHGTLPKREVSRLSYRGPSPCSSAVGSATLDGCGGHCVAFENFCYYILQVIFVMGSFTGLIMFCVGFAYRWKPTYEINVLAYIGALVTLVCLLLLTVQCRVRIAAQRRKSALRLQRANVIPMNELRAPQQPLIVIRTNETGDVYPSSQLQVCSNVPELSASDIEEPGVPWWRRMESNNR